MGHIRPVRVNKLVMKTTHREIVEKFVYKDMQAALHQICSAFVSDKHNATYGAANFVDAALAVASKNGYVGAVLKNLRGDDKDADTDIPHWVEDGSEYPSVPKYARVSPTPQWFLGRLDGHSGDELSGMGADMLDASLQAVRSMGRLPARATLAVDGHDRPCHAPMDEDVMRRSKPKGGTSKMESYLTMHIANDVHLTTSAYPYTTGDSAAEIVRRMIHHTQRIGIKIEKLLLDRGFYTVEMLRILREEKIPYIMAVRMTKPIGAMVEAYHDGRGSAIVSHTVGSGKGAEKATLLIHKRRDADKHEKVTDKYIVLAFAGMWPSEKAVTNSIPEEYRRRWSIETGYRNTKNMSIKSRSMIPGVRCFLFKFSLALTNFWALANAAVSPSKTGVVVPVITIAFFVHHIYQRVAGLTAVRYGLRAGLSPPAR